MLNEAAEDTFSWVVWSTSQLNTELELMDGNEAKELTSGALGYAIHPMGFECSGSCEMISLNGGLRDVKGLAAAENGRQQSFKLEDP